MRGQSPGKQMIKLSDLFLSRHEKIVLKVLRNFRKDPDIHHLNKPGLTLSELWSECNSHGITRKIDVTSAVANLTVKNRIIQSIDANSNIYYHVKVK